MLCSKLFKIFHIQILLSLFLSCLKLIKGELFYNWLKFDSLSNWLVLVLTPTILIITSWDFSIRLFNTPLFIIKLLHYLSCCNHISSDLSWDFGFLSPKTIWGFRNAVFMFYLSCPKLRKALLCGTEVGSIWKCCRRSQVYMRRVNLFSIFFVI